MSKIYDLADTWNAGGTTFTAIKMNVTNTASAAGSQLIDLQTGGTQRFGIRAPHISLGTDATPFANLVDVWNTSGTMVGIKYNVTDTASNASSLLMDLQVGGVSQLNVTKIGRLVFGSTGAILVSGTFGGDGNWWNSNALNILGTSYLGFGAADLRLYRDGAANTLAQRNGTNAQVSRLYNTYTDASNYERWSCRWDGNILKFGTEKAGTGVTRQFGIYSDSTRLIQFDATFIQIEKEVYILENLIGAAKYQEWSEMTAPAAPAANKVRIYAEDNGSGKTRLMARFNTGAAQQIAIEP